MRALRRQLQRFTADEGGATAIEYGLIAAFAAVGVLAALGALQGNVGNMFTGVSDRSAEVLDNIDDVRPPEAEPEPS